MDKIRAGSEPGIVMHSYAEDMSRRRIGSKASPRKHEALSEN
jgi:hypothetical protein